MTPRQFKKPQQHSSLGDILATGVLVGVFGGFLFTTAILLLTRYEYSKITTVVVRGNTVVETTDIQNTVRRMLSENCFVHATCGYGLWVPLDYITTGLLTQFPRIHHANISYRGNGVLSVDVSERTVMFRFCLDEYLLNCYFADSESILFERAPQLSDLRYIPTVIPDATKIAVNIVGKALPLRLWGAEDLEQYRQLGDLLAPYGRMYRIRYSKRDIVVEMDRLYDYSLVSDTALLKFNKESLVDPERMMYMRASLDRLISFQPFVDKFKLYPQSLDYLDLRFPKRLYMKFDTTESEEIKDENTKKE